MNSNTLNHGTFSPTQPLELIILIALLLSVFSNPSYAETTLPDIGPDGAQTEHEQSVEQQFKALEDLVKEYTTYQLSDDSALQLKTDGFQIETNYQHGIVTEFEAKDGGEVTFRLKIPF